ncbi:tRNA uridine-5-carboxymethylaminomethyl(34) synthesis GTPase MnmE [uncultured Ruminococcus sp.]|uniref:tRNA uridine-5-carboxymethylaminomethyl(34) synthesis GTPase MnmE n=1 Tax=uncultured Ruminococcus sp. TaxID=165186 RepID=UPI002676A916|nr:tRNA uridine-5-carboxymethylaminomethyl(34) synthesis GTPase MnmE [uncultured Ruminococcus sp.]
MSTTDTIAAIATPHAAGGISVIRISGSDAVALAQACFRSVSGKTLSAMPGYTCTYGSFLDTDGTPLDDGIATVFRAPRSYTGEDTVEFSCHGGIYVTRRILQAVLHAGASAAQPGEFTKRAFLSGKMTLTQAEAVMDIIGAAGNRELRFARAQQEGALYRRVRQITDQLVHCLGDLAAWADYPEDEIPAVTPEGLQQSLTAILQPLEQTLATYDYGRILRAGVSAVIVGKPNVGKSTLFNLLSGSQRSIVTEIAGTTRDVVEEQIRLGDVTLRLSDTAGLRETEDIIEQIGVRRAGERLRDADLILAVFDATRPLDDDDRRMLEQLPEKPVIAILNKSDQPALLEPAALQAQFSRVISMAAKDGNGLEELRQAVEELFYREQVTPEMGVVSNERQKQCLEHARAQILQAQEALKAGEMLDAVTVLLEEAADALLTLTGERVSEAVVNDVFARFCVGK